MSKVLNTNELCFRKKHQTPSKKFIDILDFTKNRIWEKRYKILIINVLQSQTAS